MTMAPPTSAAHIIDEGKIFEILQAVHGPEDAELADVLAKARELQGLDLAEAAVLLQAGEEQREAVYQAAKEVKEAIYGKRMVLFAPLYVTNYCQNDCLYCSFRRSNRGLPRKRLSQDEIRQEVEALEHMGHKRVLLVFGEDAGFKIDDMVAAVQAVYETRVGRGEIRRANVNAAPMEPDAFRALKDAGIGTYQNFQETYHRETYKRMHPSGRKADYDYRMTVFDRAHAAGVDDLGMGALFGLYDPKFEVLALLMHSEYLDRTYGSGPHTISFPRIEPAPGVELSLHPPYQLSDDDLKLIVATLRLAVPYTGIVMSTRETPALRNELLHLGVSQLSAASSVTPGGYMEGEDKQEAPQFINGDHRSLDEIIHALCEAGFMPSFCTSCYRRGRTGADFMDLAKPGLIRDFCLPNGLLTFKEYLEDYASPATRACGDCLIETHVQQIPSEQRRAWTREALKKVQQGERDLYL